MAAVAAQQKRGLAGRDWSGYSLVYEAGLDIFWLGHSAFRIKGKETTVVMDPCHPDLGYPAPKLQADIVTISHGHKGHSYLESVTSAGRTLQRPGEYEVKDVLAIGWNTYHDNQQGKERGSNVVFLIEFDGMTLCHLGDIGHLPGPHIMTALANVDILFLPVGGFSALPVPQAAEIMRHLSPRIVVPMHYRTPVVRTELEPLDKFLKEVGAGDRAPQPKLSVNRAGLPSATQIVVLNYGQK